ncbi:hypothetical protein IQ273_00935 [Nodosilinea sp. LEGE 07298]|uniref:hypothetical protein n=1 Tax=Nodosilinea sp. LEGE 07298 TaxID=2777970 RepID=UPI001A0B322D|nr:hypothetical protein [Nodosilinea sp. LEGE 07298]MBE9107989.1 hypothetical protein [Nodosilinea sp. LEGE 07298]
MIGQLAGSVCFGFAEHRLQLVEGSVFPHFAGQTRLPKFIAQLALKGVVIAFDAISTQKAVQPRAGFRR